MGGAASRQPDDKQAGGDVGDRVKDALTPNNPTGCIRFLEHGKTMFVSMNMEPPIEATYKSYRLCLSNVHPKHTHHKS